MGGKGSGRKPYKRFTAPDNASDRKWPVVNLEYHDQELVDEAVTHLRNLYDAITAEWIVDGEVNELIDELAEIESVCIANGVLKPSKMGQLLRMMASGMLGA